MILSCNSCSKKFVVPDQAITADGRLVQCGACGNKWKQFPIKAKIEKNQSISVVQKKNSKPIQINQKIKKIKKNKKKVAGKLREINLYSPEYLAKKHGITLEKENSKNSSKPNGKISFGFYNSLLLFIVIIIILSRGLYFFEGFVIKKLPFTEFYIDYFFESIRNIFEIWKNLISSY